MSIAKVCKVEGCSLEIFSRVWCLKHYTRWRRHGDPLGGGTNKEKHQYVGSLVYTSWCSMKWRCSTKNTINYNSYKGRGIKVCERWQRSFLAFYEDMGDRPSQAHTIDRIDNDGNYEPSNCRWATKSQQSLNKRSNNLTGYRGVSINSTSQKNPYMAHIHKTYIATFSTPEEAAYVHDQAALQVWGDDAMLNFNY